MTEIELLKTKIKHLVERKRLITSEIDFKLKLLRDSLALQDGFKRSGKYEFKLEVFED